MKRSSSLQNKRIAHPQLTAEVEKPYCLLKYQQAYQSASNRLIQFFTLHRLKKHMDYESKTKYQRELMDQILKQLREFLKKKATREFQIMARSSSSNSNTNPNTNNNNNNFSIVGNQFQSRMFQNFQMFDEINFRNDILKKMEDKQGLKTKISPFQTYDLQDEILNQVQGSLAIMYAQL